MVQLPEIALCLAQTDSEANRDVLMTLLGRDFAASTSKDPKGTDFHIDQ